MLGGKEIKNILTTKDLKQTGQYLVRPEKIYDGDTFHGIYYHTELGRFMMDKFRIARINAAEIKKPAKITETMEQKLDRQQKALNAKQHLIQLIAGKEVLVDCTGVDLYQRLLAEILVPVDAISMKIDRDSKTYIVDKDGIKYLNLSNYLLENGIVEKYE